MSDYIDKLEAAHPIREPMLRNAIDILHLPLGSSGLDAGCGIGLPSLLLADAVGPGGHVTGLDISEELLDHADKITARAKLSDRISFKKGNIDKLPFDDSSFDWIWSADCAGYPAPDQPEKLIAEFTRAIKPGGIVAILAWSSEKLLPGYPSLEAKLGATASGIAPFVLGRKPQYHFLNAMGWFSKAGLTDMKTSTIAGNTQAPLKETHRIALESFIQMRWPNIKSELSNDDWSLFQRITDPNSADFILNRNDYYAFYTYTMFYGRKCS